MGNTLSGNDVVIINLRTLTDFADAKCTEILFPNELANVKTGKNGNAIFGQNWTGEQCEVNLRLLRGSGDDKFLNGLLILQKTAFASTVLMQGEYLKKLGDGVGNLTSDIYVLSNGIFMKNVEAQTDAEGTPEQSVAIYKMKFSWAPRSIT